jgi:hypothetical protein|tara:strand:+ start:580 stop:804 length:225 start_codon:yes stop_codon:yes gene_type:complete
MQDLRFSKKIEATKPTPRMWDKIKTFIGSHSTLEYTCRNIYTDARYYNLYNGFAELYKDSYITLVKRTAKIIKN